MNSYRHSNRGRGRGALLAASVIVVAIFLIDLGSGGAIRAGFRAAGAGVYRSLSAAGAKIAGMGLFSSKSALEAQNAALESEVRQLQLQNAQIAALQTQNQELRALTHLAQAAPGIAAPVISSFSSSPYGTFAIGAGQAEGGSEGALVRTPDGFVIGKISSVSAHQAIAVQLFSPGQKIDVLLSGTPVSLAGEGGGIAVAQLPGGTEVALGAVAEAPSLLLSPVGVVGDVQAASSSPIVRVLVRTPANLSSLSYVYVAAAR